MPTTAPTRVTAWDRVAITTLGVAGFALSYDALRQTAIAIHVRGPLTYAFPLIIDGFIAYGVRALLVLRGAAFSARAYAWSLLAVATAASIWANVLHAVCLNDGHGLHLGDTAVGALSMIAPLALAGAVHLLTLITRHTPTPFSTTERLGRPAEPALRPADHPTPRGHDDQPVELQGGQQFLDERPEQDSEARSETDPSDRAKGERSFTDADAKPMGRPPGATMEQLLACARPAVEERGLTRAVVEEAVRAAGYPLGSARFTQLMNQLRAEHADPVPDRALAHPEID